MHPSVHRSRDDDVSYASFASCACDACKDRHRIYACACAGEQLSRRMRHFVIAADVACPCEASFDVCVPGMPLVRQVSVAAVLILGVQMRRYLCWSLVRRWRMRPFVLGLRQGGRRQRAASSFQLIEGDWDHILFRRDILKIVSFDGELFAI